MMAGPLLTSFFVITLQWAVPAGLAIEATPAAPTAMALASTDGQAQSRPARMQFEVMDLNNDGQITRDEWRGSARSFEVHDWNGDGRLSGNEVRLGAQQNTNLEEADHNPSRAERYVAWTDAGFTNLDHNRDRRITPNEWHYDRETFLRADRNRDDALNRAEFLGADMDDDRGDQFEDLDVNGNGRVERAEWHASEDAFTWLDRNRDGVLSRLEVAGEEQSTTPRDQFASLDYDRNGTIARNEWHWSLGSFTQRDLNRDGVLSPREFAATADTANPSTAPSQMVRVNSQQRWTDTGITVRAGDVLTFTAQGTIKMSDGPDDLATPAGSRIGRTAANAPVNAVAGALIARIGDSAAFLVGNQRSITAPVGGRLYLGVNDDHLPDNTGEFEVTVGIQGRTTRY